MWIGGRSGMDQSERFWVRWEGETGIGETFLTARLVSAESRGRWMCSHALRGSLVDFRSGSLAVSAKAGGSAVLDHLNNS